MGCLKVNMSASLLLQSVWQRLLLASSLVALIWLVSAWLVE